MSRPVDVATWHTSTTLPLVGPAERRQRLRFPWHFRLAYPLRAVLRRVRGLIGMMCGVGLALCLTMTVMAVASAQMQAITGDFVASGVQLFSIAHGGTLVAQLAGEGPGTIKSAHAELARARGTQWVRSAIGVMDGTLERTRPGARRSSDAPAEMVAALGVDGDPRRVPGLLLLSEGRWLRRPDEIVVGAKLSHEQNLGLGDSIRLNDRDLTIVGIGRLRGLGGFSSASLAYLDYATFQQATDVGDSLSIIAIQTDQPATVRARLDESSTLDTYTPDDLVHRAEAANGSMLVIFWLFSGLTLGIGALFVSNMLVRSITERRAEFGTLRALGVPDRTILVSVVLEALLIGLAASLVGIVSSLALGHLIDALMATPYGYETLYVVDPSQFGVTVLLAIVISLVAGLVPARRAASVDPVDILRGV